MMLLTKYSSRLFIVLVLLHTVQVCFAGGGGGGGGSTSKNSGDNTALIAHSNTTQTNDPNATSKNQTGSSNPGKLAAIRRKLTPSFMRKKTAQQQNLKHDSQDGNSAPNSDPSAVQAVNHEAGAEHESELTESSASTNNVQNRTRKKQVDPEKTLKKSKIVLLALLMVMDKKIFDNCANPLSSRISHFDVKTHIFSRTYIDRTKPYDEKFMNIYEMFLKNCCHPLFEMYEERLEQDYEEEKKINHRMYKIEKISAQHPHTTGHISNPEHSSVQNIPTPEHSHEGLIQHPAEVSDQAIEQSPKENRKVTFAEPPSTLINEKNSNGSIKWATNFLVVSEYHPSIKLRHKLDTIVKTYGMNLLDPKNGKIKFSETPLDCIPDKPTDLENCCIDEDKSIEYLYHLKDVYIEHKENEENGSSSESEEEEEHKNLNKKAKFRRKIKKDIKKYGSYPTAPNKLIAIKVVKAFKSRKFKQLFSMKPKEAKKIILKVRRIQKYHEKVYELKQRNAEHQQMANGQLGEHGEYHNYHGIGPHSSDPSAAAYGAEGGHHPTGVPAEHMHYTTAKQVHGDSLLERFLIKPAYGFSSMIVGLCSRDPGPQKTKQTATSEHVVDDGINETEISNHQHVRLTDQSIHHHGHSTSR